MKAVHPDVVDRKTAEAAVLAQLEIIEAYFETDEQQWIAGTEGSSAADFTLYGMLCHFLNETGGMEANFGGKKINKMHTSN